MSQSVASSSISHQLAAAMATARYEDLPPPVVEATRRAILDWLGCALAGALEPPAHMAQRVVAGLGQSDQATVFADGRASAAGAALANGVAAHVLELDDVHKGSTMHAAAPVISAALAVAERERASGQALLLAVALGYDAALRVGEAVNPSHYRFWHPTGTAATFGAAVAAGSLLRLDADQMLDALGSAGTQAAGLWEFNADGAMSKPLHPGKAAFNGILAADLARLGFTGATRILEGERGFFRATATAADPTRITDRLGEHWKISENCYKLYSCCGHTHTAIDTAIDLRRDLQWTGREAVEQVAAIEVRTYGPGYDIVREPNPRTPYQAKFSLAYVVAAALLEGWVGLDQFNAERFGPDGVREPGLAALLDRTVITVDPGLTALYPAAWPARLALRLVDGRCVEGGEDFPRGNPENPVSTAALEDKFQTLVAPRYDADLAAQGLALVRILEQVTDVRAALERYPHATPNRRS